MGMSEQASTLHRGAVFDSLTQAGHQPHRLHAAERIWPDKNCYIDIWIEVVHCLGLAPEAMLGFTLGVDFEGDQWTFFKPSHDELRTLFGIDVQELTVWRPLIDHAEECLAAGKLVSTESDSYWLPDTAATDYRRAHGKTTIVINKLDRAAQQLGYFHNAGYFELSGEDFVKTFRLDAPEDPAFLPLFAEFIRIDRVERQSEDWLRTQAQALLAKHLSRRPQRNPVELFALRFAADLPRLQAEGLSYYHKWAFGSIRQLGAAMELAAEHLRWLHAGLPGDAPSQAAAAFERISLACKTLILKCARAVNSKKPADFSTTLDEMARDWELGMRALEHRTGD